MDSLQLMADMRHFILRFVAVCIFLFLYTNAMAACIGTYDPITRIAHIPCVAVGESRTYSVTLQATEGSNFVLAGEFEQELSAPRFFAVRIVTTAFPVTVAAIISGSYPNGCWSGHGRPTVVRDGNHFDIRLRARVSNLICTQATVPFAEAVRLFDEGDPRMFTYSVNGTPITPTF